MKYLLSGIIMCCFFTVVQSQNVFNVTIRNEEGTPLTGATVKWKQGNLSYATDTMGSLMLNNIPNGMQTFLISYVGYEDKNISYSFPLSTDSFIIIQLELEEQGHEEEVVVTATRTSRTISNTPTRVEVISGEELDEKSNMKPGDIRMLLNETTGIQAQQTSATSYNSSIRIQGLDGRYTQILRDGYPLYSGFSGGLSIMQIAPLDLRQVEVIKGSSSTLYGGGAIAGLVNLVSKTPGDEHELSFMANATSASGLDLSGFYSERYGKSGLTVFVSRNVGNAYDPANIGFTAIPTFQRYTINPRLFLYGKNTTADIGITYITENRIGGSVEYIKNGTPGYFEKNNTDRITAQFGIRHRLNEQSAIQFKNSYSRFKRQIEIPSSRFEGRQQSSFSELTWNNRRDEMEWIIGANIITDDFAEERFSSHPARDYHYNTYGIFLQNSWSPVEIFTMETGLRGDYVNGFGFELLPRISALFRISSKLTSRIGGGYGYKTPTLFNEEAERIQFQNVFPIDINRTQNERSVGGNWDLNYRTNIGAIGFSINHMFFLTRLNRPLILVGAPGGKVEFLNANGHMDSKGMETNLKFLYGNFKLFIGYTYADVNTHYDDIKSWFPLTARHRLNNVLMYEVEDKWKLGLEAYYFSPQKLSDGLTGQSYWIMGFMVEKLWEKLSVFLNFENFTDTRQTKFDSIYRGSMENPVFRDIYAPVDGFVVNGGIKIRL